MNREYYERIYFEEVEIAASKYAEQTGVSFVEAESIVKSEIPEAAIFDHDLYLLPSPTYAGRFMRIIYPYCDPNDLAGYEDCDSEWIYNNQNTRFVLIEKIRNNTLHVHKILSGFSVENLVKFWHQCYLYLLFLEPEYYEDIEWAIDTISRLDAAQLRYVLDNGQKIEMDTYERSKFVIVEKYIVRNYELPF